MSLLLPLRDADPVLPLQQGAETLRDISFKVLPGQICAILSPEFRQRKSVPLSPRACAAVHAGLLSVGLFAADRGDNNSYPAARGRSLLYLVANRRRYGEYSGDILISGMNRGTYFNENTGFMTEVRGQSLQAQFARA